MAGRRADRESQITIEDARLIHRNFKGKEGRYNREGDRNFSVLLDDDRVVKRLVKDGWNVKYLDPREEGDSPQAFLPVAVGYGKGRPPHIVMITSRGRTELGEGEVDVLDWADILTSDLIVRPYEYDVNGAKGIKAYLKSLYVTIDEDDLDRKYANIDDVPSSSGKVYD